MGLRFLERPKLVLLRQPRHWYWVTREPLLIQYQVVQSS